MLIEELDPAQRNGAGHSGPAGDVGAVEEVLTQFLLGDEIRRFVIVLGELADRSGVGLLGAGGEARRGNS